MHPSASAPHHPPAQPAPHLRVAAAEQPEPLTLRRACHIAWRGRRTAFLVILITAIGGAGVFRMLEKRYRSVAVLALGSLRLSNPVKEPGGQETTAKDVGEPVDLELRALRARLLSHDILAQAAKRAGLIDRDERRSSWRKSLSRMLWDIGGGEVSASPEALERALLDKLRWEQTTLEGTGGLYTLSVVDSDPVTAQTFLSELLALVQQDLGAEQKARQEKVAAFYDTQLKELSTKIDGEGAGVDPKQVRAELQRLSSLREELQSKLLQETNLRTTVETALAPKRQALASARAKYSDGHPAVAELRAGLAETERRLSAPLAQVRDDIVRLKATLDHDFQDLALDSEQTFDGAGGVQESHSQYFSKEKAERRSLNRVFERVQERYMQALVQRQIDLLDEASLLKVLEPPSLPARPEAPKLAPAVAGTAIMALILAMIAVALRELTRRRVVDPWVASLRSRQPLLGTQRAPAAALLPPNPAGAGRAPAVDLSLNAFAGRLAAAGPDPATLTEALDLSMATGRLATYLMSFRDPGSGAFRCALLPASERTAASLVALNIATLCAKEAPGRTVLISYDHPLSVATVLKRLPATEVKPLNDWPGIKACLLPDRDLVVVDAAGRDSASLVAELGDRAANVIFDLPGPTTLAWSCFSLPWMPVLCVAECGNDSITELKRQAAWLQLLADGRGAPVGLYLTGCDEPEWVRLGPSAPAAVG